MGLIAFLLSSFAFAVTAGDAAPEFQAKNQDGKTVTLADYKGKNVLLYFYPKDQTPGCTREAQQFSQMHSKFAKANTVVLGVSKQDEASHKEFIKVEGIPYDLIADVDGAVASKFGIGTIPIVGYTKRESILIGADGKIAKVYKDVDPDAHAKDVLADVEKLAPAPETKPTPKPATKTK